MMREFGRDRRLPGAPAASRKAPIDAAIPKHTVLTSQGIYCIVSKIARPACTEPPGLLIYRVMSALGSAEARYSNCDTITFATSSVTSEPNNRILSFINLDITSYCRRGNIIKHPDEI